MIYALVFLIVAIVAAILGFGVIAGPLAWLAIIVFIGFTVLTIATIARGKKAVEGTS